MNQARSWVRAGAAMLAALLLAASGCGGGSGLQASLPGTGGTGYTSSGTIRGFGSVKVNGVFYDDTQASVHVDGQKLTSADLGLGMWVTVQGQLGTVAATGTASLIDAWSQSQGVVGSVGANHFTLAGMNIATDSGTVYQGLASSAALQSGMRVRVFGLPTDAALTHWLAARVELLSSAGSTVVSTGVVGADGKQLNGLSLTGALTPLLPGQAVRVSGSLVGTRLSVASVRALASAPSDNNAGDEEFEGVVAQLVSNAQFLLGSMPVDASNAVLSGGALAEGAKVEVSGRWVGTVFVASTVSLESPAQLNEAEIKGEISAFVSLADFSVRGQRCDASALDKVGGGKLSDLKNGVRVQLHGVKRGDFVQVTELELSN